MRLSGGGLCRFFVLVEGGKRAFIAWRRKRRGDSDSMVESRCILCRNRGWTVVSRAGASRVRSPNRPYSRRRQGPFLIFRPYEFLHRHINFVRVHREVGSRALRIEGLVRGQIPDSFHVLEQVSASLARAQRAMSNGLPLTST